MSTAWFVTLLVGASAVTFASVFAWDSAHRPTDDQPIVAMPAGSIQFPICSGAVRTTCVVDGDTIWFDGVKIRIADIDAPEIGRPKCESERVLGRRAKHRMRELLNSGPFEVVAWESRDEDRYGRKLRVILRDGRSLGDQLVSEGLARTWSGRREPWC